MENSALNLLSPDTFPRRLKEIPDPPKKLFVQGMLPEESAVYLTVVGSRKYTPYGKEVCEKLIKGLSGLPVVIISGLALGIDAIAHRATLDAHLPTIAVPGSGLDRNVLYPAANRLLAQEIIKKGGALISEFEPTFRATAWSFPQRNRIMAGLSDAILIIEAEIKSGTLITARLGTEYNRDVLTVPGSIFSKTSEGPHMLIRNGATPITTVNDLKEALGFAPEEVAPKSYEDCTEEEKRVIALLQDGMERNMLCEKLGLPVAEANTLLSLMEIKGLIKEELGKVVLA